MKTRYSFIFFTGHGIGKIWQHTISTYPIHVHAENLEEALIKMNKKKVSLYKYNDCYVSDSPIPIVECRNNVEKIGILWIDKGIVKWEGEKVYHPFQVYNYINPSSFILPSTEYKYSDNRWIANYCCGSKTPSFHYMFEKVFTRHNPERWISSSDLLADLDAIFFKQIEDHFKNNVFPEEELVNMQELYNSKKLWRENYGKSTKKSQCKR
jgi:hypothetical protein